MAAKKPASYRENVFINCPFDSDFEPIFEAIVFTVFVCGFRAVSARQRLNSAEIRLDKILELIRGARLSIHDLSRTVPDADTGNPRFNMPFELGLDIGCRKFGASYSDKCALIFAAEKYEYQKFLSDIAGQDIDNHLNDPSQAIRGVRTFLAAQLSADGKCPPPGPKAISKQYEQFRSDLPKTLKLLNVVSEEMQFTDLAWSIRQWLEARASDEGRPPI